MNAKKIEKLEREGIPADRRYLPICDTCYKEKESTEGVILKTELTKVLMLMSKHVTLENYSWRM